MSALKSGLVFLAASLLIINIAQAKNFRCYFRDVVIHPIDRKVASCEFNKIIFTKNDQVFNTVLPADSPNVIVKEGSGDYYDYHDNELIEGVSFKESQLYTINPTIFTTFLQLKYLDASHSAIQELTTLSFNKGEYLEYLFLQGNRLKAIKDYTFVHCKSLEFLDLSDNDLEKIGKHAFSSLKALKELSLSSNKIKTIAVGAFKPLLNLNSLWMSHNKIEEISSNFFGKENEHLNAIFLNDNNLKGISFYAFEELENLEFLDLRGNECVDYNFRNKKIFNNVGIKYELRFCTEAYRKIFLDEENRLNITNTLSRLLEQTTACENEVMKYSKKEQSILESIAQLQLNSTNEL